MATVEKSVLVLFSAHQMFELVRKVDDYPQFLPWCSAGHAERLSPDLEKASVEINFKGVKQTFCTLNRLEQDQAIHMTLEEGPFTELKGEWSFIALAADACKVLFRLDYEFSSKVLEQLVGPIFHSIANSFVDSFIRRAEALHGVDDL
ncbi:MAG TPA: type II toxin-antitoxin system RatA family toxin [Limnobacter sp.]|uniref:type II toxin-antitoxin system RatA family toxin n=1 Tax=Limnobacter sp. TaxID=2003368 RepID=UPI002EDA2440